MGERSAEAGAPAGRVSSRAVRAVILVNGAAGSADAEAVVAAEGVMRAAGVDVRAVRAPGAGLEAAARAHAAAADVLVAAGGDGTVNAVASACRACDRRLGVLPLGTLNHFAGDLGVPPDPREAAAVIAAGHVRRVDAGSADGRLFLNTLAIGAYPLAVELRESLQERGLGKWPAMGIAVARVAVQAPTFRLRLELDGEPWRGPTPGILVSSGPYDLAGFPPTGRERLDAGVLGVYVLAATTRRAVAALAVHGLAGRVAEAPQVEQREARRLVLSGRRERSLPVALDGEPGTLRLPLTVEILPGALEVLAPA